MKLAKNDIKFLSEIYWLLKIQTEDSIYREYYDEMRIRFIEETRKYYENVLDDQEIFISILKDLQNHSGQLTGEQGIFAI